VPDCLSTISIPELVPRQVWDCRTWVLRRTVDLGAFWEAEVVSLAAGRDGARDARLLAFAMGQHARLGARSALLTLEAGVVQLVVELHEGA
jgi:hypothetical protein